MLLKVSRYFRHKLGHRIHQNLKSLMLKISGGRTPWPLLCPPPSVEMILTPLCPPALSFVPTLDMCSGADTLDGDRSENTRLSPRRLEFVSHWSPMGNMTLLTMFHNVNHVVQSKHGAGRKKGLQFQLKYMFEIHTEHPKSWAEHHKKCDIWIGIFFLKHCLCGQDFLWEQKTCLQKYLCMCGWLYVFPVWFMHSLKVSFTLWRLNSTAVRSVFN